MDGSTSSESTSCNNQDHNQLYEINKLSVKDVERIEYLSGMGAAMTSVLITFPINKVQFRQSLWGLGLGNALRQLRKEGFRNLYRGIGPPVMIKSINSSIMFGSFSQYHHWFDANLPQHQVLSLMLSSMMSGTSEAILTPFERVQMILQDGRNNHRYRNMFHAFFKLRRYGIREYYRGLTAVLFRNGPTSFVYFGLRGPLKDYLTNETGSSKDHVPSDLMLNFMTGAVLGAAISTVFYPLNVIRIQMMSRRLGSKHLSIGKAAQRLYRVRKGNIEKLLSGIQTNALRSFLFWGCITLFADVWRKCLYTHYDTLRYVAREYELDPFQRIYNKVFSS